MIRDVDASVADGASLLAQVTRGDLVESVHLGHLVVLGPDGNRLACIGDPDAIIYPRSSLKPLQAVAALRNGFDPDDDALLALACSSHSGEPIHLAGTRKILADAGLTEANLQNTPGLPLDADAAFEWRLAGHGPESIAANCSGKHAAMLAASKAQGYDLDTYRSPDHPHQREVASVIAELTGDTAVPHVAVDGCSAPLFSTTLSGLARAYARLATAPAGTLEHRVATAMSQHPEYVGGTGRDVTAAMRQVPGLICKDGAEGVYAGALPDGSSFAFKILDGSGRPRSEILAAAIKTALQDDTFTADWLETPLPTSTVGRVHVEPLTVASTVTVTGAS